MGVCGPQGSQLPYNSLPEIDTVYVHCLSMLHLSSHCAALIKLHCGHLASRWLGKDQWSWRVVAGQNAAYGESAWPLCVSVMVCPPRSVPDSSKRADKAWGVLQTSSPASSSCSTEARRAGACGTTRCSGCAPEPWHLQPALQLPDYSCACVPDTYDFLSSIA